MIVLRRLCGAGEKQDNAGLSQPLTADSPVVGGRRSWEEDAVGIVVIPTTHKKRSLYMRAGINSGGGKCACNSSFWILRSSREAIAFFFLA